MRRAVRTVDIEAEVAGLQDLATAALRERWRAITGREAGPGLKGELLRAALAHTLQERAFGGLTRDAAKRLAAMAEERPAKGDRDGDGDAKPAGRSTRRIKPGSRLIREWQGAMQEVVVVPGGYLWRGEVHASLSAIAKAITGTSWNGWRFFGVGNGKAGPGRGQAVETPLPATGSTPQPGSATRPAKASRHGKSIGPTEAPAPSMVPHSGFNDASKAEQPLWDGSYA